MAKFNEPIEIKDLAGSYENILCSTTYGTGKRLIHRLVISPNGCPIQYYALVVYTNRTCKQPEQRQWSGQDLQEGLNNFNSWNE